MAVAALDVDRVDDAARLLGEALHWDPLICHILPDPPKRSELAPAIFGGLVRFGVMFGLAVATEGELEGVLVAMPPGVDITPETAAAAGFAESMGRMGHDALVRQGQVMDYLEESHRTDLPAEHSYVAVVGVLPQMQRRGIGKALFGPVLSQADEAGQPCYLDTSQPRNANFFEALGFRVLVHSVHAASGLDLWTYVREPGTGHGPR